ncbi:MAG: serine/threonine protein kinase, partial [Chloroflexi bacterium]|nr:serine/threonine protein kinase [Chloroflexota bacterium]
MGESSDTVEIGRYQIIREIGRGGMAVVYLAHDPRLARQVAIKLIAVHALADEYVRRSFEREAQAIGSLQHPHILPVYDVGEHEGQTYLVMHYVEGGRTLRDLVRSGPVDPREVGRLLIEVGHALGYAHSLGLVHRDVKPHNVLIDAAGHSYLADFGLAKAAAGTGVSLATKGSIGTPAYMSPEQIRAVQAIDHHADIYSLAVTTFELLTGRQPYTGDLAAVLYQHCFAEIPAARALVPSLPPPVGDVLRRALA